MILGGDKGNKMKYFTIRGENLGETTKFTAFGMGERLEDCVESGSTWFDSLQTFLSAYQIKGEWSELTTIGPHGFFANLSCVSNKQITAKK